MPFIFDHLFLCRIPNLGSMSPEYIRHFGMPTSGDAGVDNEMKNQLITTYLSIAAMATHFKNGVNVYIPRQADIRLMYDYITDHLTAWKNSLSRGLNRGDAPIEDLILLDQFANNIYEYAKWQFTEETANSLFVRNIAEVSKYNKFNIFKTPLPVKDNVKVNTETGATTVNAEPDLPKRESMADVFKSRQYGGQIWK